MEIAVNGEQYVKKSQAETQVVYKTPEEELEFEVGKMYYIQTFSYHFVGEVEAVNEKTVVLKNSACVFDTGRLTEFLKDGPGAAEIEEVGISRIPRTAIAHSTDWKHGKCKQQ